MSAQIDALDCAYSLAREACTLDPEGLQDCFDTCADLNTRPEHFSPALPSLEEPALWEAAMLTYWLCRAEGEACVDIMLTPEEALRAAGAYCFSLCSWVPGKNPLVCRCCGMESSICPCRG